MYKTIRISQKRKKTLTLKNTIILPNGRQKVLNAFESGIFSNKKQGRGFTSILDRIAKVSDHKQLKIFTPERMLQRLSIALAQVKVRNTYENLLNKIRQILHSLYQAKEITKKVYNNIMNSIKL